MNQQEQEAAIAAFIRAKGVTRCPTACAGRTQASIAEAERAVLREHEEQREATRQERYRRTVASAGATA
jgi:hypothetical protein